MKREISAGGVVFHRKGKESQFLIIKDSYGRWSLPKGNIEKGETSEEAALREISEETGLKKLNIVDKLGDVKYIYQLAGEKIFKIVRFFLVEADDYELKIQYEIEAAEWVKPEEALERCDYKNTKGIIESAIKKLKHLDSRRSLDEFWNDK